jgi:hypothetical protein
MCQYNATVRGAGWSERFAGLGSIEIEIGQGRPASYAFCANSRMLFGVTFVDRVGFS